MSPSDYERFWAKVDKHGPLPTHRPELGVCWIYTGGKTKNGYGRFTYGGRNGTQTTAHRVAFAFINGPPKDQVLHKCDHRPCVRPSHLFDGTQADNIADMMTKGRRYQPDNRGQRNGRTILLPTQVQSIRKRYRKGETNKSALAREFGVSSNQIGLIVQRRAWKHV